jgi:hypothetical protein
MIQFSLRFLGCSIKKINIEFSLMPIRKFNLPPPPVPPPLCGGGEQKSFSRFFGGTPFGRREKPAKTSESPFPLGRGGKGEWGKKIIYG